MIKEQVPDIKHELYNYCQKVISGEIIACKKYIWACMRFIKDIDNSSRKDYRWSFNNIKANTYLNIWAPLFKHTTGLIAGQQKIFTPYERFVYGNIYGWEEKATGNRRFRKSYEQVARKNAKSQDKAIQALYELSGFGEPLAEVYIAAVKKEQTRHVWGEAVRLFEGSEYLKDKFVCKYDKELLQVIIRHKASNSFFCRLSKDDRKSGDGTNPHFFIIDEYHLHETEEYYNLATSGMMKTRKNPLLSIITTAGFELSYPCYNTEYKYVSKILDPNNPVENDRYFIAICELDRNETTEPIEINGKIIEVGQPIDDITSIEAIKKSNPILSTSKESIELIREEIQESLDKPEKMRNLLTKTFNFWCNTRDSGYMDLSKWSLCADIDNKTFNFIKNSTDLQPYCGIDLSSTIDLTSVSFVFSLEEGKYYVINHCFIPLESIDRASKRDNVPYRQWVKDGFITATAGNEVDYHEVLNYIVEQYDKKGWHKGEIIFDKMYATWLKQELELKKFTTIELPQNFTYLSVPTKAFRAKVYNRKIIHQNDPVLNWCMGNAIVRMGPSGNIIIDKAKSKFRIDPVASLINAMSRAIANEVIIKKKRRVFMV